MGLLKAVRAKLNKPAEGAKRAVPNASQFVQATRAKANEAREKLREKPQTKARPKASAQTTQESRKTAPSRPVAPAQGVQPAPKPARGVPGRADPLAPQAGKLAPKEKSAPAAAVSAAAKETREVSSGPRGGKFVQGPAGTKHYVK